MLYDHTWALASKFKAPAALCILAGALMEVPLANTGLARRCLVDLREFTKLDVSWLPEVPEARKGDGPAGDSRPRTAD